MRKIFDCPSKRPPLLQSTPANASRPKAAGLILKSCFDFDHHCSELVDLRRPISAEHDPGYEQNQCWEQDALGERARQRDQANPEQNQLIRKNQQKIRQIRRIMVWRFKSGVDGASIAAQAGCRLLSEVPVGSRSCEMYLIMVSRWCANGSSPGLKTWKL